MPETQTVAEVVEIPVQNVHPNPNNPRDEIPGEDESIAQLAGEIETMGQLIPCLVYPRAGEPGEYELWDGYRRRLAVLHAGLPALRCIVVEESKRADLEQLEVMLSTGRNHRQLSALEEAKGFQQMLALGLNESTIGKKFKQPKRIITAKAKVLEQPESVQAQYNAGQLDIDALIKLQRLAETRPEIAERVNDTVERFPHWARDVDRLIAQHKVAAAQETKGAELEALGAKTGHEVRSGSPEFYGFEPVPQPEDGDHLTAEQHVTAGHQFAIEAPSDVDGEAEVRWYRKAKKASSSKPEMSEDELTQQTLFRRLNQQLPVSADTRHRHMISKITEAKALDAATDKAMLMELVDQNVIRPQNEQLLADVTGIPMPVQDAGTGDYDPQLWSRKQEWFEKIRAKLATWSWGSLVRLWIYSQHRPEDKKLAKAQAWDPKNIDNRVQWMNRIQTDFGYRFDEHETEVVRHFQTKRSDLIQGNPKRYRVKVQH
ncbi:ParB/RepB/Spo0J family partition protein [Nesterenkonia jeotgali]|uniref:ParB-like N-terminal domain-containing protein n=1 Tax=Nesterenkonia jeotgali TaxID=317018 RepID=A0A0W8ICZ7_9MICC|nr:ParB/RepB/Spo0J family partition protein [Nesterenkonia jeotgali]KUG57794.1 hypothetical protein AVL63_04525 [Nesterenkonia jeotgali]